MSAFIDLTGDRYGRLSVVDRAPNVMQKSGKTKVVWFCECDCGEFVIVQAGQLRSGTARSCGCLKVDVSRERMTTHGESHRSSEYVSWINMKTRCYNATRREFRWYGARGIRVCDRWLNSFENFLADMGRKPGPGYSIDRIDCDGNYTPENCRWATRVQQLANRRPRMQVVK